MTHDEAVRRAVDAIRLGGVVAFPTDTLYGLAVDPRNAAAVSRLFAVKRRDPAQAVPLVAADDLQVRALAVLTPAAERLAQRFWPGPLSLVLDGRAVLADGVAAGDGSIAVRVPAHDISRALARALGVCVTATSANVTGEPPTASPDVVRATLGNLVDFVLDAGAAPGGPPSTIVDVRGEAPRLVRAGAVPWERVLESLQ